jgi:hypothetical protein
VTHEAGAIEACEVRGAGRAIKRPEIDQFTRRCERHALFALALEKIAEHTVMVCHLSTSDFEMSRARSILDAEHIAIA